MATPAPNSIHIINGALDEVASAGRGNQIVLRGVIDPASLQHLRVDDYQREPLPLAALSKLWEALKTGESLPDIELACRSANFESVDGTSDFWLPPSSVFIIDGQQRRNAALHILSVMPELEKTLRVGAMIHFGTTREWERERFKILNLDRSKVSPNVLLRNMRHSSAAVLTLYGLSFNDTEFALFERVCWKQSQSRQELMTARTLVTVTALLHAHRSPAFRTGLSELVTALDRQAQIVRLNRWRANVRYFFDLIDECFGLRAISLRDLAIQTRGGFLSQVANVLSLHTNFWKDDGGVTQSELFVGAEWRNRLKTFPIGDPNIQNVIGNAGSGYGAGSRGVLLYGMLRDHLNRGLTTNRLRNRKDDEAAEARPEFSGRRPMPKFDPREVDVPGHD